MTRDYRSTDLVRLAAELVAIVESCDDAIVSKDLDGIIRSWNRGAERLFGYTADEAIGRSVTMLIPPERADEEPEILARLRRGERVDHFESIRVAKDGRLVNVSLTISPVRDATGQIVGASKVARDITERIRSDEALRERERQFREMIDALPVAIYTTDRGGPPHALQPGRRRVLRPGAGARKRPLVRDLEAVPPRRPADATR